MCSDPISRGREISPTPSSPSSAEADSGRLGSTRLVDFRRQDAAAVEWRVAERMIDYPEAVTAMEARVDAIARGDAGELVWLVEHPAIYTAGTSAGGMPAASRFPVHRTGRGGQVTYHGPGQRVAYTLLDLRARKPDLRAFVGALERWLIETLASFGVGGERREDRVGVWVRRPEKRPSVEGAPAEDKIAAIGIRVRRWVSFHGISLNVDPDLSHYADIVPCGIEGSHLGVTSLVDLGRTATMGDVDRALREAFADVFGPVRETQGRR